MKIKKEYSIALLVVGGIALLIFGVNFLKGLDLFQKRNVYHVVYNNVSGITGASPVYFHGYKVGQVISTQLKLDGTGRIVVSFQMNEDELALPNDTKVEIYSADIFTRAIQLRLGTSTVMAQAGDTLIGDAQLSLTDAVSEQIDPLKAKAESMISSIDSVLSSFQQLLNPEAVGDIDSSFTNIRTALESLSNTARRLDQLVAVESATLSATLGNLETVTGALARNSEAMDHIFTNMDTLTSELARGRFKQILDELAVTSAELRKVSEGIANGDGTMGKLMKDDSLYNNLNDASRELDLLMEDFRVNPNRYVHLSLFGKKDRLPKLSDSDIDRIGKALEEKK